MTRKLASSPEELAESKSMEWIRQAGLYGGSNGSIHQLEGTRYFVKHCGHPTANWPWYGIRPDGSMILHPSGYAFQLLADCKAAVIREYRASLKENAPCSK